MCLPSAFDAPLTAEGLTPSLFFSSVTTPEPLPSPHPLYTLPNVVLTPHMSGLSRLYGTRCGDLLEKNVQRLRQGKGALNAFRGRGEDD